MFGGDVDSRHGLTEAVTAEHDSPVVGHRQLERVDPRVELRARGECTAPGIDGEDLYLVGGRHRYEQASVLEDRLLGQGAADDHLRRLVVPLRVALRDLRRVRRVTKELLHVLAVPSQDHHVVVDVGEPYARRGVAAVRRVVQVGRHTAVLVVAVTPSEGGDEDVRAVGRHAVDRRVRVEPVDLGSRDRIDHAHRRPRQVPHEDEPRRTDRQAPGISLGRDGDDLGHVPAHAVRSIERHDLESIEEPVGDVDRAAVGRDDEVLGVEVDRDVRHPLFRPRIDDRQIVRELIRDVELRAVRRERHPLRRRTDRDGREPLAGVHVEGHDLIPGVDEVPLEGRVDDGVVPRQLDVFRVRTRDVVGLAEGRDRRQALAPSLASPRVLRRRRATRRPRDGGRRLDGEARPTAGRQGGDGPDHGRGPAGKEPSVRPHGARDSKVYAMAVATEPNGGNRRKGEGRAARSARVEKVADQIRPPAA